MYRFGWFSTGTSEAACQMLTAAMDSIEQGEIDGRIEFIFCNRERGDSKNSDRFLDLAESYHIPLIRYSYPKYQIARGLQNPDLEEPLPEWRLDYDREVMKRLKDYEADISVLAGFMMVTGPELCQKYDMINLHPALPGGPVGDWKQVIWELIGSQARETGVLMNLVTPEMDKGPVVTYCKFSIQGEPFDSLWQEIEGRSIEQIQQEEGRSNELFKLIRQHGLAREFPLIIATMKAFSNGKIRITDEKQVVDAENRPIKGYNLTEEIDEKVKGLL